MIKHVEIYDEKGKCHAVYSINRGGLNYTPPDSEFQQSALDNAVADGVVPKEDRHKWTAKVLP